jgi:hypothetical protein
VFSLLFVIHPIVDGGTEFVVLLAAVAGDESVFDYILLVAMTCCNLPWVPFGSWYCCRN